MHAPSASISRSDELNRRLFVHCWSIVDQCHMLKSLLQRLPPPQHEELAKVPTLYIWGDADDTVGQIAAEGTRDFIEAPYRFETLHGIGHFAAEQAPERVSELLLQHVAAHPI
jgi:pimeloyl-ACP methyl ester carboxylesterase